MSCRRRRFRRRLKNNNWFTDFSIAADFSNLPALSRVLSAFVATDIAIYCFPYFSPRVPSDFSTDYTRFDASLSLFSFLLGHTSAGYHSSKLFGLLRSTFVAFACFKYGKFMNMFTASLRMLFCSNSRTVEFRERILSAFCNAGNGGMNIFHTLLRLDEVLRRWWSYGLRAFLRVIFCLMEIEISRCRCTIRNCRVFNDRFADIFPISRTITYTYF